MPFALAIRLIYISTFPCPSLHRAPGRTPSSPENNFSPGDELHTDGKRSLLFVWQPAEIHIPELRALLHRHPGNDDDLAQYAFYSIEQKSNSSFSSMTMTRWSVYCRQCVAGQSICLVVVSLFGYGSRRISLFEEFPNWFPCSGRVRDGLGDEDLLAEDCEYTELGWLFCSRAQWRTQPSMTTCFILMNPTMFHRYCITTRQSIIMKHVRSHLR